MKCSFGYYFNLNSICTKADQSCQTFNEINGDCLSCYPGFALGAGKCNRETQKVIDANCNNVNSNGVCVKCSSGYYFRSGLCTKVDDFCKNFDIGRSNCTTCYPGYALNAAS